MRSSGTWNAGVEKGTLHPGTRLPRAVLRFPVALVLLICSWLPVSAARGETRDARWAILIFGPSGDAELHKAYTKELTDFRVILEDTLGFPRDRIMALFEDFTPGPDIVQRKSTREDLQAVCRDLAGRVQKGDTVFVFIQGHGNFDGEAYKLNLAGPDPTGEALASMLYSIPARHFVVVNTTSSSGGSLPALSKEGSIVIAATKSGMGRNLTHLSSHFIDAFRNNAADSNKDGRVSIMEAFSYASQKIEAYYKEDGSLQTENPVLDDDGDGKAQSQPGPDNGEGLLARSVFLAKETTDAEGRMASGQRDLLRESRDLETQIEALKYQKNRMAEAEYERQLEALLMRLAQIHEKLSK